MTCRVPAALAFALVAVTAAAWLAAPADAASGKETYEAKCALCHANGLAGAPKFGDRAAWAARLRAGGAALNRSALQGTPKGMPAKGGDLGLADADVRAAVDYMLAAAGVRAGALAAKPAGRTAPKSAAAARPEQPRPAPAAASPGLAPHVSAAANPNAFNRLLTPASARNPPPSADGIHDPSNAGTAALQAPRSSFEPLPRAGSGNHVNWVAALEEKRIQPRAAVEDANAQPTVMDLNIVREVKGSMPDVVYPHKQHTEWLDCSNCHPAIFVPQKGANQISMAAILLGQKCGVCHGKVAFPVSDCRRCHSKNKGTQPAAAAARSGAQQ
jgi:c(7)-type cytochrome triheme protein